MRTQHRPDIGHAPSKSAASKSPQMEHARELVLRFGWNATAYQILNPGIAHWFAVDGQAVVGFVSRCGVRVVAGAPICDHRELPRVIAEFEADARQCREQVCYFGAAGRLQAILQEDRAYSSVILGAQPVWEPCRWEQEVAGRSSLRAQLNRARNKGVAVAEWPGERAANDAGLVRALQEWLASRALPPMHFLVEPQTLSNVRDRRVWVATQDEKLRDSTTQTDKIVGFLIASPVPLRNGWLIEQTIRGDRAPNGTAELLIDSAVRTLCTDGAAYLTLGLVPLSRHAPPDAGGHNPLWLRLTLSWVRAHGRRFYNFDGLDRFKAKFSPGEWEPIWAISREKQFSPRTLYAISAAFCDAPIPAIARGLAYAVRQESQWLLNIGQKKTQ
jgi:phosphatidylglycerol lysyltransferase